MIFFNFLIHIKNSYLANKNFWYYPASNFLYNIGKILKINGYIKNIFWIKIKKKSILYLELNNKLNFKYIEKIKFFKNSNKNLYLNKKQLLNLNKLSGIYLLSTSKGIMTSNLAFKLNLGGKLICYVW
uniref:30S ribosomal protein S8 n=1 Tax=Nephromyces sp. ex Molgula occidentalis TaxID=2544991 RepID=A0A5C1H7Y1_9APIC|nr:30S ribosomal protein S8 [Nephromyces sp. ex Molgula occidentalis]